MFRIPTALVFLCVAGFFGYLLHERTEGFKIVLEDSEQIIWAIFLVVPASLISCIVSGFNRSQKYRADQIKYKENRRQYLEEKAQDIAKNTGAKRENLMYSAKQDSYIDITTGDQYYLSGGYQFND